jgi:hypothetical protein
MVRPQRVFLYRDMNPSNPLDTLQAAYGEDEIPQIEKIVGNFAELPIGFMTHREGFALQPARLVLESFVSFIEADHRFLYAMKRTLEPLSITEYGLEQIPDSDPNVFLGRPWVESFYAPEQLKIRNSPEKDGRIVATFPAGIPNVEKIHTVDEGWVLVRVEDADGEFVTGYVKTSKLLVIN